jgi:hypothetical protein
MYIYTYRLLTEGFAPFTPGVLVYINIYIYICRHIYIHINIYIYTFIYIYIYKYIYRLLTEGFAPFTPGVLVPNVIFARLEVMSKVFTVYDKNYNQIVI